MKKIFAMGLFACMAFLLSCGGGGDKSSNNEASSGEAPKSMVADASSYDPKRGEGKFDADNLKIEATLNAEMAASGEKIQGTKCASCHKTTEEKLVGPGWKGVTTRRTPQWIMNFITNPDPMIDKDPEVQAQLEICLVRMPNQSLTDDDARHILEFMRKNDGLK
ncbi:MAG: cytochrome c [Chitinophagaceae bacterium]|nr:cytochrome c [Chitinophagaceae bacterium]